MVFTSHLSLLFSERSFLNFGNCEPLLPLALPFFSPRFSLRDGQISTTPNPRNMILNFFHQNRFGFADVFQKAFRLLLDTPENALRNRAR
ncbi:MAG: hypothetical protein U1F71_11460 [Verrucomicrobiaceae bacterium]